MAEDEGGKDNKNEGTWQVQVEADKCSLCDVCGKRCPTGAIHSEQRGETLTLLFGYRLCNGCRECIEHCPEEAMTLVETSEPSGQSTEQVLAASEMVRCTVCGARFAPVTKLQAASRRRTDDAELISEQCPLCRRTQMVARLIEERREAQGRKAEYRTGKKWSWKPVVEGDPDAPPCPEVLNRPANPPGRTTGQDGQDAGTAT